MTTVAANLEEMACDSMASDGFADFPVSKVHAIRGSLVGFCGTIVGATKFIAWFRRKGKPPKREEHEYEQEAFWALELNKNGLWIYENSFVPYRVESEHFAIGAGAQAARAAMFLGKTPVEAVEVACLVTPSTTAAPIRSYQLAKRR